MNRDICPLMIRLLINLYVNMKGIDKWDSCYTNELDVYNGIKQGCVFFTNSLFLSYLVISEFT